jgi:hypothetical protein
MTGSEAVDLYGSSQSCAHYQYGRTGCTGTGLVLVLSHTGFFV